ncbi:MAG: hypothetical protein D6768_13810, partial [Chloroflexi bacterium]
MNSAPAGCGGEFAVNFMKKHLRNYLQPNRLRSGAGLFQWLTVALLAILMVLAGSPVARAQSPEDADVNFYVVQSAEDAPLTVGDRITLRLEVTHPPDSRVQLPQIEKEWGDFEVVSQTGQDTVVQDDGTAVTRKDIVVSLFAPGQYQTPPLVVTHRKADNTFEELGAPVIPLTISSVLVEGDDTLRDIKEQFTLPVPPTWPLVLAGLLLGAALAAGLLYVGQWAYNRWWQKTPLADAPQPVIDTRPPEVIAYAELDRISALDLPAQSKIKQHYSLVADCLRDYIERRYQIPALEQTTDELNSAFRRSAVPLEIAGRFINLFYLSDLVKFARLKPGVSDAYQLLDTARALVADTTPAPEP